MQMRTDDGERRRAAWPLGAVVFLATTLAAEPGRAEDLDGDDDGPPRWRIALFESAIALGIPAIYYWTQPEDENVDIDLAWDWDSWEDKLTFDAVRFDTNAFYINAFRHPVMSVVSYHIGRTNNFGMLGSVLLSTANGVIWEYLIEFKEYPSINDLIMNAVSGVEIGEPLWQIGQLWRGGILTPGDRAKTTLFSPLDGVHDAVGRHHLRRWRPRAWRSIVVGAGGARRELDDDRTYSEAVLVGDIDIVRDRRYVSPGRQGGAIKPGTWSRIRGRMRIGDVDAGTEITGMELQSRTAIAGTYHQDDAGNGAFAAVGTAFTYRRDRLPATWDHVVIAHIVGPQVQLSRRTPGLALRFDAAAYGDFAMIDAHVFGATNPFPAPPPYISALQAEGYYQGAGVSGMARLRIDWPAWSFDAELDGHQIWQLDGADRVDTDELRTTVPLTAHEVSDARVYWRAQLGYRHGWIGITGTAEGSHRRGAWRGLERSTSELAFGVLGHVAL